MIRLLKEMKTEDRRMALLCIIVGYFAAKIAADFSFDIREKVFDKVAAFGSGEVKKFSAASLITRTTNDITQIQMVIAMGLQVMIKAPIMAVWAVAKIVGTSWQLSVVTAGAVVLLITVIGVLMFLLLPKFRKVQKQVDDVNRVTRENLTGLRVVRAFNAEAYQEEKFEQANEALMKTQMFTMRGMAFLFPVMIFVQSGLTLAIYWIGAYLINGIAIPAAGTAEVLIDGEDIRAYTFRELYDRMGYVPQKAVLFSDTIQNNVAFGSCGHAVTADDVSRAVEIAQADEFVGKMEHGLESRNARGGSNVSGGQKQRLSIARAIARKPEILIFDDSFSALDYKTDRALREKIAAELKGTTCLIVAQRIGTIRHADKIVVLDNGEAVGIGTHEELMQTCPVYREIALSQLSQAELA
ncbi:MAG TPA: ABC transporter ATP-binding protein [Candidatus Choladocola avistercoris]|nr:ABC transporter ATP-binding protein [Candidatus Choladocola avistercoris]